MHIDQSGQHRFTYRLDWLRLQRFRFRRGAFINLRDLAPANQDRTRFDYLAVADKNTRVLNEPRAPAVAIARENFCFR